MGPEDHGARGRGAAGLGCSIGSRVFREGIRRDFSRTTAQPGRGKRKEVDRYSLSAMFAHLALVLIAGIWLPGPLVAWFQHVAALLG